MAAEPIAATLQLVDEAATRAFGRALGQALRSHVDQLHTQGFQLNLSGDLGAGKTSLVRALLREMNVSGPIKSPTFALLEPYKVSRLHFYHFDFYRFTNQGDLESLGFRELFGPGCVDLIEWPEKAGQQLPTADLALTLTVQGEGRQLSALANTELGKACLKSAIERLTMSAGGD